MPTSHRKEPDWTYKLVHTIVVVVFSVISLAVVAFALFVVGLAVSGIREFVF